MISPASSSVHRRPKNILHRDSFRTCRFQKHILPSCNLKNPCCTPFNCAARQTLIPPMPTMPKPYKSSPFGAPIGAAQRAATRWHDPPARPLSQLRSTHSAWPRPTEARGAVAIEPICCSQVQQPTTTPKESPRHHFIHILECNDIQPLKILTMT